MKNTVELVSEKNFFDFEKKIKDQFNEIKEKKLSEYKKNVAKTMLKESETVGDAEMRAYHELNLNRDENPSMDDDDDDFITSEDIEELEGMLTDEDFMDDEVNESIEGTILEEGIFSEIMKIAKTNKGSEIKFENGQSADLSPTDAKIILDYIKRLAASEKEKFERMLTKNSKSFLMAVNLAVK